MKKKASKHQRIIDDDIMAETTSKRLRRYCFTIQHPSDRVMFKMVSLLVGTSLLYHDSTVPYFLV